MIATRNCPSGETLVTSDAVADHFNVTVDAVQRWAREQLIPCYRVSRRVVRFRISEVEQALSQPLASEGDRET